MELRSDYTLVEFVIIEMLKFGNMVLDVGAVSKPWFVVMICCCQVLHHSGCHGGSDVKVAKDMEGANEMG